MAYRHKKYANPKVVGKINTKKKIFINDCTKPISIESSDNTTYFGDTSINLYDDFKISLVLTDNCGAVIGSKIYFPKRGDIMIFRPDEIHFGRFPKSSPYKFVSVFIPTNFFDTVFPKSKKILSPFLDNSENRINRICLPEPFRDKLIEVAEELLQITTVNSPSQYFDILAFAKVTEALDICNKFYHLQDSLQPPVHIPPVISKALQKIEEDFPAFSGLESLAGHCGCSVTYLTQTFRRYTGKSIHSYLTGLRLEHARRLLQNGCPVTESCYQSGFSDCSGFIVLFKKHYNITPGKYKSSCRL